jgi:hypothetical protein
MGRYGRAGGERRAQASLSISYRHEIHAGTETEMRVFCHAFTLLQTPIN